MENLTLMDGALLLLGKAGRTGMVQPGKEKAWCDLMVPQGAAGELERAWKDRTRDNGFS